MIRKIKGMTRYNFRFSNFMLAPQFFFDTFDIGPQNVTLDGTKNIKMLLILNMDIISYASTFV